MTGGGFTIVDSRSDNDNVRFKGQSIIRGPSSLHLPTLTIGLLGVQLFWSVEMSYGSPYLLSLGLSKSAMATVFLAGPVSGLVMQPLIGILADTCTSSWGRRRPFMVGGILVCVSAMLLLGWTRHVAGWFTSKPDTLTIWLAVLAIYVIDFSINAVQAVDRALVVDMLPASSQASGNAWAARMFGVGSVVGFFAGNLDIPHLLPFLGHTQLEGLTIVVSLLLVGCHMVTILLIREKILLKHSVSAVSGHTRSFKREIKDMFANMLALPRVIRQICMIQFFSWIAWFPILFYTSLYIGDLHKREFFAALVANEGAIPSSTPLDLLNSTIVFNRASGLMDRVDLDALDVEATRKGSRALFYSAIVTLTANLFLPLFVSEASRQESGRRLPNDVTSKAPTRFWKIPAVVKVHLASLWTFSHAVFAGCMLATFFTTTVVGATFLITITGFSWAITQWAPFSLLAEAILTEPYSSTPEDGGSIRLTDTRTHRSSNHRLLSSVSNIREASQGDNVDVDTSSHSGSDSSNESDSDVKERIEREMQRKKLLLGNTGAGRSLPNLNRGDPDYGTSNLAGQEDENERLFPRIRDVGLEDGIDMDAEKPQGLSAKAGIILGIHNIFVVLPQFLVTGLSSLIFAIFDPEKSALHGSPVSPPLNTTDVTPSLTRQDIITDVSAYEPSNAVVYVFRVGGVSALVACVLCYRLSRELLHR